jgi:hypothetical protein
MTEESLTDDRINAWRPRLVECPKCNAQLLFGGNRTPRIDACGFESCALECRKCGTQLSGIVDPYDEALLVSILETNTTMRASS